MQIYKTLYREIIHEKEFPMGSIILTLDNNTQLVCNQFHLHEGNLELYVWLPIEKKWVITYARNRYTKIMFDYYRRTQKKKRGKRVNYENMMKHERYHKNGGGGVRIHNGSITDYECAKNPLHDFRKCYN